MCGICGFIGAGSQGDLARMSSLIVHRGPDDSGEWISSAPPVFLASRRLAVVDLSDGHQPMATADGEFVVAFNGEIYNHRELRLELEGAGYIFQTDHSDTEVLLAGYRAWGPAMVSRLNGMWAFALYDRRRAQLFCSRDRFGKKPFYYSCKNGSFAFASELTSLAAHPGISREISHRALQKYFAYGYIPAPLSIFSDVLKLPAGCSLIVNVGTLEHRIEKYWDLVLEPFTEIPREPEREWGEELRRLLDRAVERRLIADVPLGVFLSGGIDSSAVTAFAARHVPEGKLKTFSVGFQEKSFDETEFGRQVSAAFKTDHRVEMLPPDRAREMIDQCLGRMDEPLGDSSVLPTYFLSGFTRKHVTVALGGDGGDELFAGYSPFHALRWAKMYRTLIPAPVHAAIKTLFGRMPVSHANMAFDFKIKRTLRGLDHSPNLWVPTWMAPLEADGISRLFNERIEIDDLYSEAIEQWKNCPQDNLVDKVLQFYTKLYLQDDILTKVDRTSMMHSLEVRAPFLDIEVVDFVRRIPASYKFKHQTSKYILKRALHGVIPESVLHRPKKGFAPPIGQWFRSGDLTIKQTEFPLLNPGVVQERLASHINGKSDERAFLWSFYALVHWQESINP